MTGLVELGDAGKLVEHPPQGASRGGLDCGPLPDADGGQVERDLRRGAVLLGVLRVELDVAQGVANLSQ
jgi:hypothetical protein